MNEEQLKQFLKDNLELVMDYNSGWRKGVTIKLQLKANRPEQPYFYSEPEVLSRIEITADDLGVDTYDQYGNIIE